MKKLFLGHAIYQELYDLIGPVSTVAFAKRFHGGGEFPTTPEIQRIETKFGKDPQNHPAKRRAEIVNSKSWKESQRRVAHAKKFGLIGSTAPRNQRRTSVSHRPA